MAFFAELYLRSTRPFLSPEVTRREADLIARALELRPGVRTLDIGCGHGRHLALLAGRCDLFGLDLDPLSLAHVDPALRPRCVRADLYAPPFSACFDAAYAWYATLFISEDDARNQAALAAAARTLKPGGRLLAHGHNPLTQRREPESRFEMTLADGAHLVEETWFDLAADVLHGHRILRDGDRVLEGRFLVRCPTVETHARWAAAAGLSIDATFGDASGAPYGPSTPDLVVRYVRR